MEKKEMKMELSHECDFTDGVSVEPERITEWRKQALDKIKGDKKLNSYIIRSGNSMVIGNRMPDGDIEIFEITNGYKLHCYTTTSTPNP